MGHRLHHHYLKLDLRKFFFIAILGGIAIDLMVIYVLSPIVWDDPAPPIGQFAVWQVFWIAIGLVLLYLSRAKRR